MKTINVAKGEIIQKSGELNSKVYEVVSGLLRSYTIDEKGKEHIYMFAPEGWIIADNNAPENPCSLFIDALEDSVIIQRTKVIDSGHEIKKLVKRIEVLQNRVIMLMSAPAIDRYQHFIDTYPDIVQRVPQKMIASYLGITPEALSAVKSTSAKR